MTTPFDIESLFRSEPPEEGSLFWTLEQSMTAEATTEPLTVEALNRTVEQIRNRIRLDTLRTLR